MGRPPFGGHRSVGAALDGVRDRAPEAPRPSPAPPRRRPARIRPLLSAHRVPGRDVNSPRPHPPGALSTLPAAMQCVNVTHVSVHPYSIRPGIRLVRRSLPHGAGSQW